MLDSLIPVSNDNSLRQVVASVYCPGLLIDPPRFKKYVEQLDYQKFEVISQQTVAFDVNQNQIKNQNTGIPKEVGYRMSGFHDGRINKVLSAEGRQVENRDVTILNFQSLNYPKWDKFRNDVINDFTIISQEDDPFIQAIALHYINEFNWASDEDIIIDEIFDRNAEFMPNKFFNSQNSIFAINTEDYREKYKVIEQLEINVSRHRKNIQVKTQVVFELINPIKIQESIKNESLVGYFEEIHAEIKKNLNSLFTAEVKRKINLS